MIPHFKILTCHPSTQILTPADFVKINELRTAAAQEEANNGGGGAARRKLAALSAARKANTGENDNFLTEGVIIGVQKKAKNSYEERLAMIAEGREGREKFGSLRHKKLSEKEHSTTNEEKRKKHKAFAMVAASRNVRKKNTSSLQQKSKKLRNHIDRCASFLRLIYELLLTYHSPAGSSAVDDGETTGRRARARDGSCNHRVALDTLRAAFRDPTTSPTDPCGQPGSLELPPSR